MIKDSAPRIYKELVRKTLTDDSKDTFGEFTLATCQRNSGHFYLVILFCQVKNVFQVNSFFYNS